MKTEAQAVVIGGGVIGCSILYHLAKLGWSDVILLERDELTSGSTWHAAANIHGLHDNTNVSRIQHYTMSLYNALEAETGQSCGVFQPGSLYLAQTEEREHQLRLQAAKAKLYGINFYEVSIEEARALNPLVNYEGNHLTSKSASWTSSPIRRLHLLEICASLSAPEPARSARLTGCAQRPRSSHGHAREPSPVSASEPPGSPGGLRISASSTTRGFLTSLHLRTRASPLRETHHDHYQDPPPACRQ